MSRAIAFASIHVSCAPAICRSGSFAKGVCSNRNGRLKNLAINLCRYVHCIYQKRPRTYVRLYVVAGKDHARPTFARIHKANVANGLTRFHQSRRGHQ
jgi:hypothetical protein